MWLSILGWKRGGNKHGGSAVRAARWSNQVQKQRKTESTKRQHEQLGVSGWGFRDCESQGALDSCLMNLGSTNKWQGQRSPDVFVPSHPGWASVYIFSLAASCYAQFHNNVLQAPNQADGALSCYPHFPSQPLSYHHHFFHLCEYYKVVSRGFRYGSQTEEKNYILSSSSGPTQHPIAPCPRSAHPHLCRMALGCWRHTAAVIKPAFYWFCTHQGRCAQERGRP